MSSPRTAEILSLLADDDGGGDEATLLDRLCVACEEALPVSGVGLALMTDDGSGGVLAATNGPATALEELQASLGEGPCVDASRSGQPVLQPDLQQTAVRRWPGFGPEVLQTTIRAVFAFPLQVGAIRLGVLDRYRDAPGVLDDAELAEALAFADAATAVLLHLQEQTPAGDGLHPLLREAPGLRPEVHQATGMISVYLGRSLADALARLRGHAYAAERPILEVARDVVDGRLGFEPLDQDNDTG